MRVLDRDGNLIAQQDNVPQQWTYPTNKWKVGQPVVDFYDLSLDKPQYVGDQLAVLVYDEQSLQPVVAMSAAGTPLSPIVQLRRAVQ